MKIYYKRKRLRWTFVFGFFWLLLGLISVTNRPENYFNYLYLVLAVYYIGTYLYKRFYQYMTIDDGTIIKHQLRPLNIKTDDLIEVKFYSDVYILRTKQLELRIPTKIIDKQSLKELKAGLKSLSINN